MHTRQINVSNKADVERFVLFPHQLYKDNKQWVPPLLSGAYLRMNPRSHPFYTHSTAAFFVVEESGPGSPILGRVGVMNNQNYNRYHGSKTAFFFCFDAEDSRDVACRLFDAAFTWARKQGLEEISGPRGFIGGEGTGILVEGFEHRAAMGIPYNYAYYEYLLDTLGFEKETDYLSGYVSGELQIPARYYQVADRIKEKRGYRIISFANRKELSRWVPSFLKAHQEMFQNTHTYYPPTDEEVLLLVKRALNYLDPRMIKLVIKKEQVIGFIMAYPDISTGLQRSGGRLWPFGWHYLFKEYRQPNWLCVNALGVLPAFQGMGVIALLVTELGKTIKERGIKHLDISQVEEGNTKSLAEQEALGVNWYKRHRGYRLAI